MESIRLLTIKDTMASGMNYVVSPSFWTNVVSMERKTSKIKSGTKECITCEKIKKIEVMCMKEN